MTWVTGATVFALMVLGEFGALGALHDKPNEANPGFVYGGLAAGFAAVAMLGLSRLPRPGP
jgi:hypothetical protein